MAWTATGGGDHGGADWTITGGGSTNVGGEHTGVGVFTVIVNAIGCGSDDALVGAGGAGGYWQETPSVPIKRAGGSGGVYIKYTDIYGVY